MNIGIPRERSMAERRVALTPAAVDRLVRAGHSVFVEHDAGAGARYSDEEYTGAGAELSYDPEETFQRADLLVKVATPLPDEYEYLREGQVLMCFLQPVVAPPEGFRLLLDRSVSSVAMELIEDSAGNAPLLRAISEIAGPMSIHIAAHLLESSSDGRGILLGGAPGIPPATVVILGGGVVGTTAARTAVGNGAHVLVLDREAARLRKIDERFSSTVTTMFADKYHLSHALSFADVVIGGVLVRGGRTPILVTDDMLLSMKRGSVVIDVSIDQGGCLETVRPTSIPEPTYTRDGVVHYAVPNMTANVARTATQALTNAAFPYIQAITDHGLEAACFEDPGLCRGVVTSRGHCLRPSVAEKFNETSLDPAELMRPGSGS